MTTLADAVTKSFSECSSEELQERLRTIRRQRRMPPPKKESKPRSKSNAKPVSAKDMTPEDAAELLKLLGV